MAVAADLPDIENRAEFQRARNSVLYDRSGQFLGELTSNNSRVILKSDEISLSMQHAIIAIEDRRFYQNSGVDLRGIGRALFQDVVERKAVQGGSTIAQQFVKNALAAQDQRTIFQKAARGRAGLPPHAQVVEGEDPHRVPELDLLRQRRVRDRVGRAHVLRHPARRLRPRRPALRQRADAGGVRAARGRRVLAEHVRPGRQPRRREEAARPRPPAHARAGLPHAGGVPARDRGGAAGEDRHPPALRGHEQLARGLLRELGPPADRRSLRRAARVRGRPAHLHDARRQAAAGGRAGGQRVAAAPPAGRRRRSSRSTTPPARCARWSAARTSRRTRSTSRRRASASRARRSSRSCSRPPSSAASRRARSGRRRS